MSVPASRLAGRPAAPGFAAGTVLRLGARTPAARQPSGRLGASDIGVALEALRDAMARAVSDLRRLEARQTGEAADMLAFQIAMLEDEALSELAIEAIHGGQPPAEAWAAALAAEIRGYEASRDEYFQARAADLADIRDRVLALLTGTAPPAIGPGQIVVAEDVTPSLFLAADWAGGGLALTGGSPTSHVAMLARARAVPMVVGLPDPGPQAPTGTEALLDATAGTLLLAPSPDERAAFAARGAAFQKAEAAALGAATDPALTDDGTPIAILINVADPRELDGLDPAICDGIGLVRTELLFEGAAPPDEATQLAVYSRILRWAAGRPVTVRTLDAGGDKPIAGLTPEGERNPFLGVRGVRLSLRHPDMFKVQLRALARAAAEGPLDIMIPMVSVPEEIAAVRGLLADACADLAAEGLAHRSPALGIMVEVPAAAITPERFDADFFSIGSNDLVQYTLAAGRDVAALAAIASAGDPAVLRLIATVAAHGAAAGRKVSLCGEAGGEPALVPLLLDAGLRVLSMAPAAVPAAKAAIRRHRLGQSV